MDASKTTVSPPKVEKMGSPSLQHNNKAVSSHTSAEARSLPPNSFPLDHQLTLQRLVIYFIKFGSPECNKIFALPVWMNVSCQLPIFSRVMHCTHPPENGNRETAARVVAVLKSHVMGVDIVESSTHNALGLLVVDRLNATPRTRSNLNGHPTPVCSHEHV